jgi:hypothetical protein
MGRAGAPRIELGVLTRQELNWVRLVAPKIELGALSRTRNRVWYAEKKIGISALTNTND